MTKATVPDLHYISYEAFQADVLAVAQTIGGDLRPDYIVGIGRGGLVPAVYLSHALQLPMLSIDLSAKVPGFADELLAKIATKSAAGTRLLFVDDINDSGGTIAHIRTLLKHAGGNGDTLRFAVLINNTRSSTQVDYWSTAIDRESDKRWFVFPWEAVAPDHVLVGDALAVPERLA